MPLPINKATSTLLLSLYDGPFQDPSWKDFLVLFREWAEASAANIALQMPTGTIKGVYTFDEAAPQQNKHSSLLNTRNAYEKEYAQHSPFPYEAMDGNTLYLLDDVIPRNEFEQSRFYLEFSKPLGFEHQLCVSLIEKNGYKAFLHLARNKSQGEFSQELCEQINLLIPHLQQSLQIYAELQRNQLGIEATDETLSQLGVGLIIINSHGKKLWQNQVAQRIIKENKYISDNEDVLEINLKSTNLSKKQPQHWSHLLETLLHSEDIYKSIAIALPSDNRLGVLARHWQGSKSAPFEQQACFIIYLTESENDNVIQPELIQQLFSLTPSEAKLAARLAEGLSLNQAATQIHITEKSARSYCKRIYAKTGVTRQTELVSLVRNSVAYIARRTS